MAAAVVTVVVEDILQSLEEGMKLGQQWGVEHEIIEIHHLLSSILGVLPEAENKYRHSLTLQEWVENLKHAAFDVEDLLEELSTEDALWQRKRKVRRLLGAIDSIMLRWRMRAGLRAVARQLRDLIRSDRISFITNIPAEIGEADEEARVVPLNGRGHYKREVMRHLLHRGMIREQELPVLTVYGEAGIGKTACVQELCSELELNRHFDIIIWVFASPPFDENKMARDIITSTTRIHSFSDDIIVSRL